MALLEIKDLHVSIEDKEILKGLSLSIEENEIHYSEKNQELYALKDCRNVQIRENKENLTLR